MCAGDAWKVWGAVSGCLLLWGASRLGTLADVNAQGEPMRLELEVQFEPQPIRGRLYGPEGDGRMDRAFSGWLGLLSALEAARRVGAPALGEALGETLGDALGERKGER